MGKRFVMASVVVLVALSLALAGCKGKVEKVEEPQAEQAEVTATQGQEMLSTQAVVEPAQVVATETIPPTAAVPQVAQSAAQAVTKPVMDRSREIQTALKAAGFYSGTIDGKIGPKTKKAIMEFQAAKGLKVDGKVGPKTWAELEKYLVQ